MGFFVFGQSKNRGKKLQTIVIFRKCRKIKIVKNKFFLYISYVFYLIVLGQGCSGIANKPNFLTIKIPSIEFPNIVKITDTELPKTNSNIPEEDLYRKAIEQNSAKQLAVKTQSKAPRLIEKIKIERKTKALNIDELEVIAKDDFNIQEENKSDKLKSLKDGPKELTNNKVKTDGSVLSLSMHIEHNGFELKKLPVESMTAAYELHFQNMKEKLAQVSKKSTNDLIASKPSQKNQIDPNSKEAIENFEEQKLQDIVSLVEASNSKDKAIDDDLVFFDYSKDKKTEEEKNKNTEKLAIENTQEEIKPNQKIEQTIKIEDSLNNNVQKITDANATELSRAEAMMAMESSLEEVSKADISDRVQSVIHREMGGQKARTEVQAESYAALLKEFKKDDPITTGLAAPTREIEEESKLTIHAIHTELDKEMSENLHGFSMYSASNNNKAYEDYNSGKIEYEYSLNGYSGILRATLVKNFYIRTTIEAPLSGEFSNVEVPMIDIKSIEDYLDKNELSGYGGYYLVDLGEYFEDVEISSDQNTEYSYEQRVYLDENFKIVKSGNDYRYILFLGVIPGNIRVQYLGANRIEASKITFVAPDEMTFDIATSRPSHEINFDLTLKNTLGVQNVPLDLNTQKMTTFVGAVQPVKTSSGKYSLNIPWGTKGSRTYIEVNHLESPIFVGVDGGNKLELPSLEFVQEIMRSFQIDGLNERECLVQVNFDKKEVVNVSLRGESAQGPMTFEQNFLDKDGVFTKYVSPMSGKLFILGNEEGIFPILVEYADGKKDYLRTYCSPGSYILEQL